MKLTQLENISQNRTTLADTAYFGGAPFNALIDRHNIAISLAYSS